MPCFFPRPYAVVGTNPTTGKNIIKILNGHALPTTELAMACKQCTGCRLERSRQWAVRCVHEMKQHKHNCFITLTYKKEDLPKTGLVKRHVQLFMKRFRKKFGQGIRYYYCGEYGEKFARPHYHAIIFGFAFDDLEYYKTTDAGDVLYKSETLSRLWPHGFSSIGEANFESAAYVARYIMKKKLGKTSVSHYNGLTPEFTDMSRRPGIGKEWWEKNKNSLASTDQVVLRGRAFRPPEYYDKQFEKYDLETHAEIKRERKNTKTKIQNRHINERKYKTAKEMAEHIKQQRNAAKRTRLDLEQNQKRKFEK